MGGSDDEKETTKPTTPTGHPVMHLRRPTRKQNSTASSSSTTPSPKKRRRRGISLNPCGSTFRILLLSIGGTLFVVMVVLNIQFSTMQSHEKHNLRLQTTTTTRRRRRRGRGGPAAASSSTGWDALSYNTASRQTSVVMKNNPAANTDQQPQQSSNQESQQHPVHHPRRQITLWVGEDQPPEPTFNDDSVNEENDDNGGGGDDENNDDDKSNDGGNNYDDKEEEEEEPSVKERLVSTEVAAMLNNVTLEQELTDIFRQPAPWRTSRVLPKWMKEYIAWHQDERAQITADNWDKNDRFKFLIIRCVKEDLKCGGTADRLKPLPFFLYVASKLQRILLIWWEKPAPLEEFLLPPPDGLDWRVPSYILDHPEYQEQLHTDRAHIYGSIPVHAILNYIEPTEEDPHPHQTQQLSKVRESNHTFLTMLFQSHGHGSYEYNNLRYQYPYFDKKLNETVQPLNLAKSDDEVEASYEDVFRDVWYTAFVPIPTIQKRVAEEMIKLGLRRNKYQAVHIRSQYHFEIRKRRLLALCRNAIRCVFMMDAEKAATSPIYVSADHPSAVWAALKYGRDLNLPQVTARNAESMLRLTQVEAENLSNTLHLDRGSNVSGRKPEDWNPTQFEATEYYDTFVDLYLLAQAECIAINVGNYGKWANLISDNRHCEISHMKSKCPETLVQNV